MQIRIKNFNPGPLKTTKNLYFFDNCIVEYFKGDPFKIYGSIDVVFIEGQIDISYFNLTIIKDLNGKTISLSKEINREIEKAFEDLLESKPIEDEEANYNYRNLDYLNGK
jgi:hypothetical protein